ncbi:MAG: nucleotidyltransferase family protein [Clostridiales bacterium]|nr:nucleotidyltransferase family protein [Clostridiales bacterium]
MSVTGVIAEFDPFHGGHLHLISEVRRLVPGTDVVCAMSGSFTQRGAPSCADKLARARAAAENGADLVLELPVARALAPAPLFAAGGVEALSASGVVTHLAFGSECGDGALLERAAKESAEEGFSERLKALMACGKSYAAAAAEVCSPESAALLGNPNDLLAAEYIRAAEKMKSGFEFVPVKRVGAAHGSDELSEYPSAFHVRKLLAEGREIGGLPLPENVKNILKEEASSGRFPLDSAKLDAAVLAVIRRMSREDLEKIPDGGEGLGNRIYAAAAWAKTVNELCFAAKCRRYTLARVRRAVWQAFVGVTRGDQRRGISYLRVLAVGKNGRELLRRMEKTASVPVVTKPAALNSLGEECRAAAELEARADSLRSLGLSARDDYFRRSPFVLKP